MSLAYPKSFLFFNDNYIIILGSDKKYWLFLNNSYNVSYNQGGMKPQLSGTKEQQQVLIILKCLIGLRQSFAISRSPMLRMLLIWVKRHILFQA